MSDFTVADHGSIIILSPDSDVAKQWISDNIPDDAQIWCNGIAIERRYFEDIYIGIKAENLTVS